MAPNGTNRAGYKFDDTVALGNYPADTHPIHTCVFPLYEKNFTTLPCTYRLGSGLRVVTANVQAYGLDTCSLVYP